MTGRGSCAASDAAEPVSEAARPAYWSTAISVYVLWGPGTLAGAPGATLLPDPEVLGLDAAAPAAFLLLRAPFIAVAAGSTALLRLW